MAAEREETACPHPPRWAEGPGWRPDRCRNYRAAPASARTAAICPDSGVDVVDRGSPPGRPARAAARRPRAAGAAGRPRRGAPSAMGGSGSAATRIAPSFCAARAKATSTAAARRPRGGLRPAESFGQSSSKRRIGARSSPVTSSAGIRARSSSRSAGRPASKARANSRRAGPAHRQSRRGTEAVEEDRNAAGLVATAPSSSVGGLPRRAVRPQLRRRARAG